VIYQALTLSASSRRHYLRSAGKAFYGARTAYGILSKKAMLQVRPRRGGLQSLFMLHEKPVWLRDPAVRRRLNMTLLNGFYL
jgi:hypothetical protein